MMPIEPPDLALFAALALLLSGCSTSLGIAGAKAVSGSRANQVGLRTMALMEVPVLDTRANLTAGLSASVLERTAPESSAWGEWRLGSLLGLSQMPRPNEFRLGYEAFLSAGLARYQLATAPRVGSAFGLLAGAPIRLGRQLPTWRADELIALQFYLVPSVGIEVLAQDRAEVVWGLAIRGAFWSSAIP